jgi:hypothetical protein
VIIQQNELVPEICLYEVEGDEHEAQSTRYKVRDTGCEVRGTLLVTTNRVELIQRSTHAIAFTVEEPISTLYCRRLFYSVNLLRRFSFSFYFAQFKDKSDQWETEFV